MRLLLKFLLFYNDVLWYIYINCTGQFLRYGNVSRVILNYLINLSTVNTNPFDVCAAKIKIFKMFFILPIFKEKSFSDVRFPCDCHICTNIYLYLNFATLMGVLLNQYDFLDIKFLKKERRSYFWSKTYFGVGLILTFLISGSTTCWFFVCFFRFNV